MSEHMDPDPFDEAMADAGESDVPDDGSFDEFDAAVGLSSLRSAWAGSDDRFE
jgi:hypothetical protein